MQNDLLVFWLHHQLKISRKRVHALLSHFPFVEDILSSDREELKTLGLPEDVIKSILSSRGLEEAEDRFYAYEERGIRFVSVLSRAYPRNLHTINDLPCGLFMKGELSSNALPMVAMVGSRRCTSVSEQTAYVLAKELAAAGVVVVSGMARGIDSAANMGALAGKGETVAVMGCGLDHCYPAENRSLMERIVHQGLLISEYVPEQPVYKGNFPERNRIIAGLGLGLVVVEAGSKSGVFSTVDAALDNGRTVFAVPGPILGDSHAGSNRLLQEGAVLTLGVQDILDELGIVPKKAEQPQQKKQQKIKLDKTEETVYSCLDDAEAVSIDRIAEISGLPAAQLQSTLTMLELKGLIRQVPGKRYLRQSGR